MRDKCESQIVTHLTLANAFQIAADVIVEVAGEEISTHISGERMYGNALHDVLAVKFRNALAPHMPL